MNTKEIARGICSLEGKQEDEIKDLVSAISATLKPKIDKKETFGREDVRGEHFYGLIDWFDENGKIKPQFTLL